jgi:hypothetical protein
MSEVHDGQTYHGCLGNAYASAIGAGGVGAVVGAGAGSFTGPGALGGAVVGGAGAAFAVFADKAIECEIEAARGNLGDQVLDASGVNAAIQEALGALEALKGDGSDARAEESMGDSVSDPMSASDPDDGLDTQGGNGSLGDPDPDFDIDNDFGAPPEDTGGPPPPGDFEM